MAGRDFKEGFKSGDRLMIGEAKAKAEKAKKANPTNVTAQNHWWQATDKDLPNAVLAHVQAIIKNDKARIESIHLATRLYGNGANSPVQTLGAYTGSSVGATSPGKSKNTLMGFNVIQTNIDTLLSKMVKNKPMPFFLTSKGSSKLQRKAKGMNQFVKGVFFENDAYNVGRRAVRDCLNWPAGITQVYREHGRIKYSRVLPEELLVDYLESHYGAESTQTIHRVRIADRTALAARFPKYADAINAVTSTADVLISSYKSVGDSVATCESWRLPSSPDADDGVHCIIVGDVLVFREKWKRTGFPFAVIRYNENLTGFWGQSLNEQLQPIQRELNRILRLIQQSQYMMSTFKILVHKGSKIVDTHFDNRVGTQISWAGEVEPKYVLPPAVQPEVYAQVPGLKEAASQQSGVSQLSIASQKPAGLNAAVAIREFHDVENDRFQVLNQGQEDYYLQLANLSVLEARELHEELKAQGKELTFKVPGKKFLDTVDWASVDMEEDQYVLQCYPISKLPSDPAGRLETIQELIQGGFISRDVGNRLLDFPDIDAEQTLMQAMRDYIQMTLDDIVDRGHYTAPEPDDNHLMALSIAVEYLAVGKRDKLGKKRMAQLRSYISQCQDYINAAAPPPAMPGAPGPDAGPAPANPEPTPTSPLLPNVNGAAA